MAKTESGSATKVAVDYDIEHYRPKNRVTPWPSDELMDRRANIRSYVARVATGYSNGYLRFAFDPFNYLVSCKVCNSSYKSDCFPIAGIPDSLTTDRASLDAREKPLLLFPLGERADDPGEYLFFRGPLIGPRPVDSEKRLRAQVVIDFFELDTREDLLESRCEIILLLWPQLENRFSTDIVKQARAELFLRKIVEERRFPQSACGRAFIELYDRNKSEAEAWHNSALEYLTSKERSVLSAVG